MSSISDGTREFCRRHRRSCSPIGNGLVGLRAIRAGRALWAKLCCASDPSRCSEAVVYNLGQDRRSCSCQKVKNQESDEGRKDGEPGTQVRRHFECIRMKCEDADQWYIQQIGALKDRAKRFLETQHQESHRYRPSLSHLCAVTFTDDLSRLLLKLRKITSAITDIQRKRDRFVERISSVPGHCKHASLSEENPSFFSGCCNFEDRINKSSSKCSVL